MNKTIDQFARETILAKLKTLNEQNHDLFRLMYARNGGKRSVPDALAMPLEDVVAEIPSEKLSWALTQIENSIAKLEKTSTLSDHVPT